ncbi:MBL fold metallo-hydrolase [Undibacterium sp.]|uniref:MBL fold metallo-hydrolase n=1 Tax=Undibacterium sp. TaxID=1914977 RepID=UPI002C8E1DE4|nr:MBL fold metallo-hydrolase [Undibacterium sp.]HTD02951.1 MBL fold metallo-hydrolase [Undibacterium sp.]
MSGSKKNIEKTVADHSLAQCVSMAAGSRRSFLGVAAALAGSMLVPAAKVAASAATPAPTLKIQRLAWAGIRLQYGSSNLYIDPLINPDVWGPALKDKMVPISTEAGDNFVLVTHRHPDHFDPLAIKAALGENGTLVHAPLLGGPAIPPGIRTRIATPYEPVILGEFTVTAVPAVDGYGDPQVSWIVSVGGKRIIHCGDTMWHGYWWQIGRQYGPFDAAFLPINGARFSWRQPASDISAVMTPEEAVAAAVVIGARLIVPIHYGVDGAEGYAEVAMAKKRLLDQASKRKVGVEVVSPGDWLTWRSQT